MHLMQVYELSSASENAEAGNHHNTMLTRRTMFVHKTSYAFFLRLSGATLPISNKPFVLIGLNEELVGPQIPLPMTEFAGQ